MANEKGSGRKYAVVNADAWEQFSAGATFYPSLSAAQEAADAIATEAEESEPGRTHRFAIVEEAGVLETEVQTKVKRNFATSRRIERKPKGETEATESNEAGEQETGTTESSASESTSRKRNKRNH